MRPSIIGEEGKVFSVKSIFTKIFMKLNYILIYYIVFIYFLQEYNPINSVRVPNNSSISGWEKDMLYVC